MSLRKSKDKLVTKENMSLCHYVKTFANLTEH